MEMVKLENKNEELREFVNARDMEAYQQRPLLVSNERFYNNIKNIH